MDPEKSIVMERNYLDFDDQKLRILKERFFIALGNRETIIATQKMGSCYVSLGRTFGDHPRNQDFRWISVSFPELNMRYRFDASLQTANNRINCETTFSISIGDKVFCCVKNNPRWSNTIVEGEFTDFATALLEFFSESRFIEIPAHAVKYIDNS
jgi:hypothetical protein